MGFTFFDFMTSLIFGAVGVYYYRLGKKNQNFTVLTIGIVLCLINFFITNHFALMLVGGGLWGYAYYQNT